MIVERIVAIVDGAGGKATVATAHLHGFTPKDRIFGDLCHKIAINGAKLAILYIID